MVAAGALLGGLLLALGGLFLLGGRLLFLCRLLLLGLLGIFTLVMLAMTEALNRKIPLNKA